MAMEMEMGMERHVLVVTSKKVTNEDSVLGSCDAYVQGQSIQWSVT
jgi:hypothetical protein